MEAVASGRQPEKEGSEGARGRWRKRARFPSCRNIIIFSLKRGYSEEMWEERNTAVWEASCLGARKTQLRHSLSS